MKGVGLTQWLKSCGMERDDEIKTFAYRYTELCYTSSLWLIFTDFTFVELSLCFKVLS